MENKKNPVLFDFFNCIRLIQECIKEGILQQPDDDKNSIFVCRIDAYGNESWNKENIHVSAHQLQDDFEGQRCLLNALLKKGKTFTLESTRANVTREISASKEKASTFIQNIDWTPLKEYVQHEYGIGDDTEFVVQMNNGEVSVSWKKDISPLCGLLSGYLDKAELRSSVVGINCEVSYDNLRLQAEVNAGNYDISYEDIGGQVSPCVLYMNVAVCSYPVDGAPHFTPVFCVRYEEGGEWSFSKASNERPEPNRNEIAIKMGDMEIVAEKNPVEDGLDEICVYLRNKDGYIVQDLCLVRPHYEYVSQDGKDNLIISDDKIDCLVWEDAYDEDYTHSAKIPVWKEESEE